MNFPGQKNLRQGPEKKISNVYWKEDVEKGGFQGDIRLHLCSHNCIHICTHQFTVLMEFQDEIKSHFEEKAIGNFTQKETEKLTFLVQQSTHRIQLCE